METGGGTGDVEPVTGDVLKGGWGGGVLRTQTAQGSQAGDDDYITCNMDKKMDGKEMDKDKKLFKLKRPPNRTHNKNDEATRTDIELP